MISEFQVKTYSFKGNNYYIAHSDLHASWWTHEDESIIRDAIWDIEPDDQVLDIGCAFGSYALTALSCGASRVWAWNPLQDEMDLFNKSLHLNGWSEKAILYFDGLYSSNGWLIPYEGTTDAQFSEDEFPGSFHVTSLDASFDSSVLDKSKRIWMKLDVESAEVEVLKGSVEFINEFSPIIVIECHTFAVPDIETQIERFMEQFPDYVKTDSIPYHSVRFVKFEKFVLTS